MDRQNYIELVTVPFQAGESKLFAISGQYFELIDAASPVDVVLTDRYGAQRGLMRQAEASFNLKATEFATVQLTSAAAQTVRFAYGTGEGGTRRAAGAVSIVGTVPVSGPLTDAQLRAARVPTRPELPYSISSVVSLVAGAATLLTPAQNPNGFVIANLEGAGVASAGGGNGTFLAKSSAPATLTDGDVLGLLAIYQSGGSNALVGKITNVVVPAGKGIYFFGPAGAVYGANSIASLIGFQL